MLALYIVAGILLVILLVLSIPVDLAFAFRSGGDGKTIVRVEWLFGLVGREMVGRERPEEKAAPEKPKFKKKKRRFKDIFAIVRTKGLLKQFKVFIRDLLPCLKIKDLNADIRVGLGSPNDTGLLFAFIGPPVFWLSSTLPFRVNVQPAFEDEATFEGHAQGKVKLRPIQLFIPISRFLFSPATLRLLKNLITSRWKRKKK